MKFSLWLVLVPIAFSGATQAGENRFVVTDAQSFDAAAAQVRTQLSSDRYAHLTSDEKQSIDADMTQMHVLLTYYGPVSSLNRANAIRYFNIQEHLNGLLFSDLAGRYRCDFFRVDNVVTCATYARLRTRGTVATLDMLPAATEQVPIQMMSYPHRQGPQGP